ncbi:hypothetical protein CISIN_1g038938mg, partial [Citrus sinensis]
MGLLDHPSTPSRIACSMIKDAEDKGSISPGKQYNVLVEITSANAGIGLASIASSRGYKIIVKMPNTYSIQRRMSKIPNAYLLQQHENPANPKIWKDSGGKFDALVAGIRTGGTITGAEKFLKEKNLEMKVYGIESVESAVLNGGKPGLHLIQGIGIGIIPTVLDIKMLDEVKTVLLCHVVTETTKRLALKGGLL